MREIKFRAWVETNQEGKQMVDLYKCTPFALDANLKQDGLFIPFSPGYKLMQYTGLKDRNGKEIYEGDVCGYTEDSARFVVVFGDGSYRRKYLDWEGSARSYPSLGRWDIDNLAVEIIGNIYENPELLTQ